jgi:predicted esterase
MNTLLKNLLLLLYPAFFSKTSKFKIPASLISFFQKICEALPTLTSTIKHMQNRRKRTIIIFTLCFQTSWLLLCEQPTTIFCHGILDNQSQLERYKEFIEQPRETFDFPDAQEPAGWNLNNFVYKGCSLFGKKPVNREKMYMGHSQDIEILKNKINPDTNYILFGFSRGGTTIINYLAQNDALNVKAVILNASPADMLETVNTMQYAIGYKFAPNRATQEYIFNTIFPAYQTGSIPPIEAITTIKNKNLPIFIVHSKTDMLVHISSSWQLYLAFLQAGFTDVYLCELESGEHKAYQKSPDKIKFLQNLHSFYKKYHFNYNQEFATFDNLANLQPSINDITEKLVDYKKNLEKIYRHQLYNNKIFTSMSTATMIVAIIWYINTHHLRTSTTTSH